MKQLNDMATAIRLPSDLVAEIDAERRDEKDIPSRAEMIRRLLADALRSRRVKRQK
jgi:metal-responsive CopG/Arc/MetJ family transcriptional regulator